MSNQNTIQENKNKFEYQTAELEKNFVNSNVWADQQVIEIIKRLSEELHYKDVGYTIGSLHNKVAHIVSIMKFFKLVFENQTPEKFPDLSSLSREEVIELWESLNNFYIEKIGKHPNGKERLTLLYNITEDFDVRNIYFDVYTHSAYHRGQVMVILSLLGEKTQNTDYLNWYFSKLSPRF